MERTSRIGWVPKDEHEKDTIEDVEMEKAVVIKCLEGGLFLTKKDALVHTNGGEVERVKVTVTVDVERI
jgi:hypothetical protein